MRLARRSFLKSGTLTALSAALASGLASSVFGQKTKRMRKGIEPRIPLDAQRDPLFFFTSSTFEPYIGSIFQAPNALGQMINLTLIRVTTYKPQANTKATTGRVQDTDSFSLVFSASEQLPPFTSIHNLNHAALGRFNLFLAPKKGDNGTILYEAVFNHLR